MRALLPGPVDDPDLYAHYGTDWLEPGGVRVNFVSSVDGASSAGGVSGGLQTPGDNKIFSVLRDLADVVLAGAGTVVGEGYGPVTPGERRQAVRREHGLRPTLPLAILSRTLRLDPEHEVFTGAGEARTIVLTCRAADPDVRHRLERVADVVDCGEDAVDSSRARAALEECGFTRILCEGGPSVFARLAVDGVVDELCLSVSPLLAGPGANRIVTGDAWPDPRRLSLSGLLEEDGALFHRYRVADGAGH